MKLRRNEYCPIHRSLFCCGREQARKERRFQLGVQRIEDSHHPRGFRSCRQRGHDVHRLLCGAKLPRRSRFRFLQPSRRFPDLIIWGDDIGQTDVSAYSMGLIWTIPKRAFRVVPN
jgi:hypothetical protein